jgi:hypothetical protein
VDDDAGSAAFGKTDEVDFGGTSFDTESDVGTIGTGVSTSF